MILCGAVKFFLLLSVIAFPANAQEQCGEPLTVDGLVQFGEISERDEWPYLAALLSTVTQKFFCGGSLISRRHILTAAHCLLEKKGTVAKTPRGVIGYLGKYDLNNAHERGAVPVYPNEFHIHPDWKPSVSSFDADIALITLDDDAPLRSNIYPVCLWTVGMRVVKEDEGTVVGWGTSENQRTDEHENIPHKVKLKIVSNEVCYKDDFLAQIISYRTFCAGGEHAGPCRGDSGGGLYTPRGKKMFIRGIVSASLFRSDGSCNLSRFAVFTKVEKFTSWINSIRGVKLEMQCDFSVDSGRYLCRPQNLRVDHDNIIIVDVTGDHLENKDNTDVKEILIHGQKTPYLPVGVGKFFPNLFKYFVGASGLILIERKNFVGLSSLVQIECGVNQIEKVPVDTFYDLPFLESLLLHGNKIEALDRDTFIKNVNLKELYIYNNQIEFLDAGTFRNNLRMEGIHIDNNKLMFIEPDLLRPLVNLKVANFGSNVCLSEHFPNSVSKSRLREIFVSSCPV